jgi:hypothetical protein
MDQTNEMEKLRAYLQDFLKQSIPAGSEKIVTIVTQELAQLILELIREIESAKKDTH